MLNRNTGKAAPTFTYTLGSYQLLTPIVWFGNGQKKSPTKAEDFKII